MVITKQEEIHRLQIADRVTVVSNEGDRWRVTRYEATVLVNSGAVVAHVNAKRPADLYYFRLRVPRQRYFSLLRGIRSPEAISGITRMQQPKGSRQWAPHFDKACCGRPGRTSSITTSVVAGLDHVSRLVMVHNIAHPEAHIDV